MEKLSDREYCSKLNLVEFSSLLVQAGFSQKAVREAANKHGWQRLEHGLPV